MCPVCDSHIPHINKSAKLTQNMPAIFVVNLILMTTFLGVGYSTWTADTA